MLTHLIGLYHLLALKPKASHLVSEESKIRFPTDYLIALRANKIFQYIVKFKEHINCEVCVLH